MLCCCVCVFGFFGFLFWWFVGEILRKDVVTDQKLSGSLSVYDSSDLSDSIGVSLSIFIFFHKAATKVQSTERQREINIE